MAITQVKQSDFASITSSDKPVLVDFWAPWCGPCRMLAPILEQVDGEIGGKAVIAKVNVDEERMLAQQFGVFSIPTMVIFKNGREVNRIVGLTSKEAIVQKLLS